METLKIKKLHPDAHIPTRAHDSDAGMDLYALPVEYTDEEKEACKSIVDRNITYAKFFDLFGGTGIFGGTLLSEKQKTAIDVAGSLIDSELTDSKWDNFFKSKIVIMPHKTKMIPTGIAIAVPTGYMGCIYARSGLASKHGLAPANCVGIVDSDYRGEVKVALHNYSDKNQVIDVGERIAQLVIQPFLCVRLWRWKNLMKLIAALAALVPPAKSKNDELWPYKVVELQSSGYEDKPIVTCEYFEDSYEKAYHTMCQHANDSYTNSLSRMSLDFAQGTR